MHPDQFYPDPNPHDPSLETELGVSLFYRMKHKQTELTPVGKLYFDYFSKTTDEFRAVQKQAHLLSQQITVSLKFGVLAGWNVSAFLQPFLQYFQKEYPNIEVQLSFLDPEFLRESADHFHPQIQLVPSLEHAIAASHNGMGVMIIDE